MNNGTVGKPEWQTQKLAELARTISTGPFGSLLHKSDYVDDGVPLVNPTNMVNERILPDTSMMISEATRQRLSNYVLEEGDIVVGRRGEIGRCAVIGPTEAGWLCGTGSFFIRPLPSIDSDFLAHLIRSRGYRKKLEDAATGTTMKNLSNGALSDLAVSIPPLPEQQRIVAILDEAFDGIAAAKGNAEKNLQNARTLFQSHLQTVFTRQDEVWMEKPLGAVCDLQNGYAFKSGDYIECSNTLNIRMSSIRPNGSFDPEHNKRFLPDSYADEYADFLLKEGDLLVAMTDMAGDPKILGVPTLVSNQNGRKFLMNQRVGKLYGFSDDVRVPYLRYFLTSPSIRQFYKNKGAGGLQINISKGDILTAKIPLPSIPTQLRIIDQLDDLSEETQYLESIYRQKFAALDALKKSLLDQAFSGAL
jgi:type I restriction enzyme S subunit